MSLRNFVAFPKIPRWSRDISISEKIDGTNASVLIDMLDGDAPLSVKEMPAGSIEVPFESPDGRGFAYVRACSKNKVLLGGKNGDNFGFRAWVSEHAVELVQLGPGQHSGEWYGHGIGRGYGMSERKFALFNPTLDNVPDCCEIVPQLYQGPLMMRDGQDAVSCWMRQLKYAGSSAVRGYKNPEGLVIYHTAAGNYFKITFENDSAGKGEV